METCGRSGAGLFHVVVFLAPDATAREVLAKINERGYRHLPVVDGGRLVGIVSSRDFHQTVEQQLEDDIKDRDSFMFAGYHHR